MLDVGCSTRSGAGSTGSGASWSASRSSKTAWPSARITTRGGGIHRPHRIPFEQTCAEPIRAMTVPPAKIRRTIIKAKYVLDHDLSAIDISVDSQDGDVALGGTVSSPELVGKAVVLALDTDGVRGVTSKITVTTK